MKEIDLLLEVLESRLGSLRQQIYHAEAPDFRDELRVRKDILEGIIDKLKGAMAEAGGRYARAG